MRDRWMMRACFWLLAAVIATQMATIIAGAATCFHLLIVRASPIGSCAGFGAQAREMWSEVLAAVLALLLATNSDPPNPPPDGPTTPSIPP